MYDIYTDLTRANPHIMLNEACKIQSPFFQLFLSAPWPGAQMLLPSAAGRNQDREVTVNLVIISEDLCSSLLSPILSFRTASSGPRGTLNPLMMLLLACAICISSSTGLVDWSFLSWWCIVEKNGFKLSASPWKLSKNSRWQSSAMFW